MNLRKLFLFLLSLAIIPLVMGQKGGCGGGQLRYGEEEPVPLPGTVEEGSVQAVIPEAEGPPGEEGEAGEGPKIVGEVKGPESFVDYCVERPPEEKPKPGCPTCNSLLPLDADVVASMSLAQALGNAGLMMLLGELQTIVSNVGGNLNLNLLVDDVTKDLLRVCAACKLRQAPAEGGAMQDTTGSDYLYRTAPQMSIMGQTMPPGVTDLPERTMAPDLGVGLQNLCEEFVLIFEGNWKEGVSSEQFEQVLISLENSPDTVSFVAETVVVPSAEPKTSTLQLEAPAESMTKQLETGEVSIEGEGVEQPPVMREPGIREQPLILRQPESLEQPLILKQPESFVTPTYEEPAVEQPLIQQKKEGEALAPTQEETKTEETIIIQEQAPTRDTIFFDTTRQMKAPGMQLVPTGVTGKGEMPQLESTGGTKDEVPEVSGTVATFNDAEGRDRPLRAGFREGMLVIGTENYFNAVAAKDSCPFQELWLSVPEGLLKMAGPVQILPWLLGQQAEIVSLGHTGVVVYDFRERLYLAIKTVDAEDNLVLHIMFKIDLGAVNAEQLVSNLGMSSP